MYGNTFDGITWVIPFAEKVRYPLSEYGDFGPRPKFATSDGQYSSTNHKGLDLNPKNANNGDYYILATRAGTVSSVGGNAKTGAGYYIYIDHGDGYKSHYFHLKEGSFLVKEGDKVAQGQKIAIRGTTGSSTGKHLHFGVTKSNGIPESLKNHTITDGSVYVDPELLLFGSKGNGNNGNTVTVANNELLNSDKGKIWTYFQGCKLHNCAIAGIMGNIECESNFKANNMQNDYESKYSTTDEKYTKAVDDGSYRFDSHDNARDSFSYDEAGYGLIQWTWWELKQSLYDSAKLAGKSIGDRDMQCAEIYNIIQNKVMSSSDDLYPEGHDATTWTKQSNLLAELNSENFRGLAETSPYKAVKYATALFLFEVEKCQDYKSKIDTRYEFSKLLYDTFTDLECSHDMQRAIGVVVPTCTETGYEGDLTCLTCGTVLQAGKKLNALGHIWDYSYGGQVCSRCSYVERYPIGGATPDTAKMKRVHNVLRDILVRKNTT